MSDGGLYLRQKYLSAGISTTTPILMVAIDEGVVTIDQLRKKFLSFGVGTFSTANKKKIEDSFPSVYFDIDYISDDEFVDMIRWCNDKFGDNWIWSQPFGKFVFFFVHQEDHLLFRLTYGGTTFKNQSTPVDAIV